MLRIVLDCLLFFVTTSQGILPCGFMSPWPELCSACDTVQYFLAHSVGASLLNSMHCLSCYSVHYRCSWYISLHWTKKKNSKCTLQVFKAAALSIFWDCFCVNCHVWSHLVYYFLFLHLDGVYYDEFRHLHLCALQTVFCFPVNKFGVWCLELQAL